MAAALGAMPERARGLLPTPARLYLESMGGNRAPISEKDFSEDELEGDPAADSRIDRAGRDRLSQLRRAPARAAGACRPADAEGARREQPRAVSVPDRPDRDDGHRRLRLQPGLQGTESWLSGAERAGNGWLLAPAHAGRVPAAAGHGAQCAHPSAEPLMAWKQVNLIGFAPDAPPVTEGNCLLTSWVVPTDRGFGPMPDSVRGRVLCD